MYNHSLIAEKYFLDYFKTVSGEYLQSIFIFHKMWFLKLDNKVQSEI